MSLAGEAVDRVLLRVAKRWTFQDVETFASSVRRAYAEARVALRAARHASEQHKPLRVLDLLVLAEAHRDHARRERVRLKACAAWLRGRRVREDEAAWLRYREMMLRLYAAPRRLS